MQGVSRYALVALVAFLAALAALWVGRAVLVHRPPHDGRLHAFVHEKLDLDARQTRQIELLEARFSKRRERLDADLRDANAELADAMSSEHGYGPAVERAVDRSHMAMGELQKATLSHVFAMRAVLRPDQARRFDKAVVDALTEPPQD
ncbi:MAG TPA: periplasmic heavy metal sensor [Sphingobium sp.]|nr:periplasmic heavy metal sensor [Sphingobium sp.]